MSQTYTRRINLFINGQEVQNNISGIKKEMQKLINEQSRMTIGSREYQAHAAKIRNLKAIMQQHNADINRTKNNWLSLNKVADNFNKYFGMITAFTASIVGMSMGFRKAAEEAQKFEERLDNLSALTGLEGEELEWLGNTAKETSVKITESGVRIKQSAADILDAYTKVGSQRPELLKNKEALAAVTEDAIILSEAAKMELEPAVAGLTTALNQHNLAASESGRVINAMAAGSKEGAADIPYLTQAMEKSGTTMSLMNVSLEENIGLIEAVAPYYSRAEMAGNSLDKVFLKMKASNIGYVNGVFSVTAAINELDARFRKGQTSAELFGVEHAKMAELLVKNRSEVERYTKAVTGTDIATEQAVKNTNNAAAALAQARNRMNLTLIEFGEKLNPVLLKSTNLVTYLIKALTAAPRWFKENQILIISLAGAVIAYNSALLLAIASQIKKIALDAKEVAINAAVAPIALARVLAMKAYILVTGKATVAQKRFIDGQMAFGVGMAFNPIMATVMAITALVAALKAYDKYNSAAIAREKEKKESVDNLSRVNETLKKSYENINSAISNFNRLSITHKTMLQEKTDLLLDQAEAELILQKTRRNQILENNTVVTAWGFVKNAFLAGGNAADMASRNMVEAAQNGVNASKVLDDGISELQSSIKALRSQKVDIAEILQAEQIGDKIGTSTIVELEEKLGKYQLALKNVVIGSQDYLRIQNKITKAEDALNKLRVVNINLTEDEQKKALKLRLEKLDATHAAEMNAIHRRHIDGKTSEAQYQADLLAQEIKYLEQKRDLYGKDSPEYQEADLKIAEKLVKAQTEANSLLEKVQKDFNDAKIDSLEEGFDKEKALQEKRHTEELTALRKRLIDKEKLSETEVQINEAINQTIEQKEADHLKRMAELDKAAELNKSIEAALVAEANAVTDEQHWAAKRELAQLRNQQEIQDAKGNAALIAQANRRLSDELIQIKLDELSAQEAIGNAKIDIALRGLSALASLVGEESKLGKAIFLMQQAAAVGQIIFQTAIANAKATAASPLTFGQPWVGINTASAAVSIASVIAQSVNTLKKPKSDKEFDVGGYTGEGSKDKPAGIVHAGEWVAPQWLVKDKHSGPLIAMLEHQRRSKTRINPQVLQSIPKGYSSGGLVSQAPRSGKDNMKSDDRIPVYAGITAEHIDRFERAIDKLTKYRPPVAIEMVAKGLQNWDDIQEKRGM